jgi:hypothetical protein
LTLHFPGQFTADSNDARVRRRREVHVKAKNIQRIAGVVVSATALFGTCAVAPASAVNNIKGFGVQETLKDYYNLGDFSSEIGYTIKDLKPSRDVVPYPVAGRLYEANATTTAVVGNVTPQIANFIARSPGGTDYRVLPTVSTLSGAPLGQGGSASGKLYFDVVGENPDSVIYNADFQDQLGWVGLQPVEPAEVVPGTDSSGGTSTGGTSGGGGATGVQGSTGPMEATPPSVSDGAQNGPYGPSGSTPPVGN